MNTKIPPMPSQPFPPSPTPPPSCAPAVPSRPRTRTAAGKALGDPPSRRPLVLPPLVRWGGGLSESPVPARLATGVEAVDRLLGGGFPRGRLSEIAGPLSSGRTSLAASLLAAATRAGEVAAWVDGADALDPASLDAAGADLARLLWVRAPGARAALRCAERLLEARGFALVVLDLGRDGMRTELDAHVWMRLARCASASGTALVLLGAERRAGSFSALVLDLRATRMHFAASPAWLEGLEARIAIARHRLGPAEGTVPVCWKVPPGARGVSAGPGSARGRGGTSAA